MRVLHIDTGRTMRGGQHQALLLHDAQANGGCEPTLLAREGIRSVREAERATWFSVTRHARRSDLIHAHDARAHSVAILCGVDRPVVVARRVAFPVGTGLASRWKYRRAAHFVAVSEHVAGILRSGGVETDRVTVIHDAGPAVDTARIARKWTHRQVDGPLSEFRIVSPDFSDPLKGRDLAIAACRVAGVRLILSNNLVTDLATADALLYLTQTEGLGSALLLAMSVGVPVIASDVGGIPEVVSPGHTGILVENTRDCVSDAIRTLHADRDLQARLAGNAIGRLQKDFSIETMARRTMETYRHVLERAD